MAAFLAKAWPNTSTFKTILMGKMSKNKGARGEREVAEVLSRYGFDSRRGQQFSGSPDSPDVISPKFPLHIEVKRVERLNLAQAFEQSAEDAGDKPPCVIHRKSREDWKITLNLKDLLCLLKDVPF